MPKIVNKPDKRRKIAQSVCVLFIQKGFNSVSISEIAKTAGIGKGTIYEYFTNKEDIIIELMDVFQETYSYNFDQESPVGNNIEEKILNLFEIFFNEADELKTQRKIYRLFLSIHLNSKSIEVDNYYNGFKSKYLERLSFIIEESIKNKEINSLSSKLIPSLFATVEGFFIEGESKEINGYIDTICKLMKV